MFSLKTRKTRISPLGATTNNLRFVFSNLLPRLQSKCNKCLRCWSSRGHQKPANQARLWRLACRRASFVILPFRINFYDLFPALQREYASIETAVRVHWDHVIHQKPWNSARLSPLKPLRENNLTFVFSKLVLGMQSEWVSIGTAVRVQWAHVVHRKPASREIVPDTATS